MEVINKRKTVENGAAVAEDSQINKDFKRLISELPCVYDSPRPHGKNILVRQHATETIYYGTRFAIPETAQKSPNKGVVVAIGPEIDQCKPGDVVTFGLMNAEPIEVDGEVFQLVMIHDVKLIESVTYAVNA